MCLRALRDFNPISIASQRSARLGGGGSVSFSAPRCSLCACEVSLVKLQRISRRNSPLQRAPATTKCSDRHRCFWMTSMPIRSAVRAPCTCRDRARAPLCADTRARCNLRSSGPKRRGARQQHQYGSLHTLNPLRVHLAIYICSLVFARARSQQTMILSA